MNSENKKDIVAVKNHNTVIYTAIFGGKDGLIEPDFKIEGCDMVCFTDDPRIKSDIFDVRLVKPTHEDPTRNARMYKILSHRFLPDYRHVVWIDGNVKLKKRNIKELAEENLEKHDLAMYAHPERSCIYQEVDACINFNKENSDIMRSQVEHYMKMGYPENNGLVMSSVFFRNHSSEEMIKINEEWWKEMSAWSKRDQLSFNFVAWKNGFKFKKIMDNAYSNELYDRIDHKIIESVSSFQQVIEIKDGEIMMLEEKIREMEKDLSANLVVLALRRTKRRIVKLWEMDLSSIREVFLKGYKTLRKNGFASFIKYSYNFLTQGREYFKNKKIT